MVMVANLQYGWTLFVGSIDQKYHWGRAAIQVAFSIFVLTETWLVPFEGYLIDRFGPRIMVCGSGVLVAVAWVINAWADSLFLLYVGAAVRGIGAGVIYGASVGNALKWFPDRRGLAAGLTAAGFGAGSAATVVPIANMIQSSGYEAAFLWFGLSQGIVVVLVSLLLRAPRGGEVPSPAQQAVQQTRRGYGPTEAIRTPVFWVGICALLYFAGNPVLFVILSGLVFFAWGEIYSLFPATCADVYGRTFATTNYAILYTAKGTASLLIPLSSVLTTATGSWHTVFILAALLNVVAAFMALFVLKPMRIRMLAKS
jgi:MFS family permease